jgi:hypothetical protein
MKRFRKHPLFLMATALALPLCLAFPYYDFYDNGDLISQTQFSMSDDGDLLNLLKKNPKAIVSSDQSLPRFSLTLLETKPVAPVEAGSAAPTSSVLRC